MADCPCGSNKTYDDCCGPYLTADAIAPTAEALMRSRYTAFVKGNIDYLIDTHHSGQRTANERAQLLQTINSTTWLGLTVIATRKGGPNDDRGIVEFVAVYKLKAQPFLMADLSSSSASLTQLHERSRFVREDGGRRHGEAKRWLYADGDQLPPLLPKRNDPCWCHSGKKFKHCHGKP